MRLDRASAQAEQIRHRSSPAMVRLAMWRPVESDVGPHPRQPHEKRDRLPSATAMANARNRIIGWWEAAYLEDEALRSRFLSEAAAALPLSDGDNGTAVYDALVWRSLRSWQDQQVPLWTPSEALFQVEIQTHRFSRTCVILRTERCFKFYFWARHEGRHVPFVALLGKHWRVDRQSRL
jgi:hypothetical protein